MMKKRVLIIDDDLTVCREIKYALQNETTDAYYAQTAKEALELFIKQRYCLVIMDITLSETDGHMLLKTMRQAKTVPILVLTSKAEPKERISTLLEGANVYMAKPYNLDECLAQAQSLMRLYLDLSGAEHGQCYTLVFGMGLLIDPMRHQVTLNGEPLELTRKEFDLLFCLASHPGQVLSREQLYDHVWDGEYGVNYDATVKAHIKSLRRKLTPEGRNYIQNVWGVGYCFDPESPDKK